MGQISISINGSFGNYQKSFSAQQIGHAGAVAQAINWLSGEVLEQAIRNDHTCHEEKLQPSNGFCNKRFDSCKME